MYMSFIFGYIGLKVLFLKIRYDVSVEKKPVTKLGAQNE